MMMRKDADFSFTAEQGELREGLEGCKPRLKAWPQRSGALQSPAPACYAADHDLP
jgi:hypothetical protein